VPVDTFEIALAFDWVGLLVLYLFQLKATLETLEADLEDLEESVK
jgi:hypothetical protein